MATKAEPKFTEGQEVWLLSGRGRESRRLTTVTKVGRLYFEVDAHAGRRQYGIDTGYEKGDAHGNCSRIRTLEEQAVADRRQAAFEALKDAGITIDWRARDGLGVETMEALAVVAAPPDDLDGEVVNAVDTLKNYVNARAQGS